MLYFLRKIRKHFYPLKLLPSMLSFSMSYVKLILRLYLSLFRNMDIPGWSLTIPTRLECIILSMRKAGSTTFSLVILLHWIFLLSADQVTETFPQEFDFRYTSYEGKCVHLNLTLVLLNPDIPCLCKQCRSRSVGFFRSQLIWICTVCH